MMFSYISNIVHASTRTQMTTLGPALLMRVPGEHNQCVLLRTCGGDQAPFTSVDTGY